MIEDDFIELTRNGKSKVTASNPVSFAIHKAGSEDYPEHALVIALHESILSKAKISVDTTCSIAYSPKNKQVKVFPSTKGWRLNKYSSNGSVLSLKRIIAHGAHNEPWEPYPSRTASADIAKIEDGAIFIHVPEQEFNDE